MRIVLVVRRLALLVLVLFGVSLVVFSMMHLTPGDPVQLMMGQAGHVSAAEIEALRHEYGLDLPVKCSARGRARARLTCPREGL